MNPFLMIISFSGSLVFGLITILMGRILYKKNTLESYSILNRFPFELLLALHDEQRRLLQIPLALFGLSIVSFFYGAFFVSNLALSYVLVALALIFSIIMALLFYTKTTIVERHVLVASLTMMISLLLTLFTAYYAFTTPFDSVFSPLLKYGSLICAFLQLAVMINPQLKNWGQLVVKENGEAQSYVRPRLFVLPASEWVTLFIVILLEALTLLAILF